MVLASATVASVALIGVDRVIDSDAHLLLGFFAIVVGMTWAGRTSEASTIGAALLGVWTLLDARESAAGVLSVVLVGLLSAAVLLTLGILLTRTFRRLILEMNEAARKDSLTGLLNTGAFQEVAERERARAVRTKTPISVAFIDLDHFKRINDAYGHLVGDAVLAAFGHIISSSVRATDVAGRVGGDEFALILPDTDRFEADAILQRIQHHIALRTDIPLTTATTGYITFISPPASVEDMIRFADDLMYHAKRRNDAGGVLIGRVSGGTKAAPQPQHATIDITDSRDGQSGADTMFEGVGGHV
jgi:diguanylate cyclase (GGDEF)-like protein